MFAIPALLQDSSPPTTRLFVPFNNGDTSDIILPSRTISLNSAIATPTAGLHCGVFNGTTALSQQNSAIGQSGFAWSTTDVSDIAGLAGANLDYTVEFRIGNFLVVTNNIAVYIRNATDNLSLFQFNSPNNVVCHGMTFDTVNFVRPNYNPVRMNLNHVAIIRRGSTNQVLLYLNGVLIDTRSGGATVNTIGSIGLLGSTATITTSTLNRYHLSYFAITSGEKYTSNFNPATDTGFDPYFLDNIPNGYCI